MDRSLQQQWMTLRRSQSQTAGGIALRIEIDQQRLLAGLSKPDGKVDSGRGFYPLTIFDSRCR